MIKIKSAKGTLKMTLSGNTYWAFNKNDFFSPLMFDGASQIAEVVSPEFTVYLESGDYIAFSEKENLSLFIETTKNIILESQEKEEKKEKPDKEEIKKQILNLLSKTNPAINTGSIWKLLGKPTGFISIKRCLTELEKEDKVISYVFQRILYWSLY